MGLRHTLHVLYGARCVFAREEFEVKARSPFLVAVAEGTCYLLCMSVLLHWLLRSLGKTLPCYVVFVVSYGGETAAAANPCCVFRLNEAMMVR